MSPCCVATGRETPGIAAHFPVLVVPRDLNCFGPCKTEKLEFDSRLKHRPVQPLIPLGKVRGPLSREGKAAGRESVHSYPPNIEFKNTWT
jgi:hypothetical protein